jgi:hypothetical protein
MGNKRLITTREGKSKTRAPSRLNAIKLTQDQLKTVTQNVQQHKCHNAKKAIASCQEGTIKTFTMTKEILGDRDRRKIVFTIVKTI